MTARHPSVDVDLDDLERLMILGAILGFSMVALGILLS
jgi:hypothetical protein